MATGVIDASLRPRKGVSPRAVMAGFLAAAAFVGYYLIMHSLHITTAAAHPGVIMLLPPITVLLIAFVLPLFMFMAYEDDYSNLNPLLPHHYFKIAYKSYQAMQRNNWKVSEKDM